MADTENRWFITEPSIYLDGLGTVWGSCQKETCLYAT